MKHLLLLLLLLPAFVFAQDPSAPATKAAALNISTAQKTMSKGEQTAYEVDIPQAQFKDVDKAWQKYIKEGSKGKLENVNGEYVLLGAVNRNIAPVPFNIYSRLLEMQGAVRLTAFFSDDVLGFYSTATEEKHIAIQKYLHDFAAAQYRVAVQKEVEGEEEKLKDLQKQLEGQQKDQRKAEESINDSKRKISENESNVRKNENDQKAKQNQITLQKQTIAGMGNAQGNETKVAAQTLKTLEKEFKGLQKDKDNLLKSTDKERLNIKDQERAIEGFKAQQVESQKQVDAQKVKLQQAQDKLAGII